MNEYTYDDLIVNPNKEGIESLIGKEVYYGDIPLYCIKGANENYKIGILREVRKNEAAPFYIEILPMGCTLNFACMIPKKEEPEPEYIPFESVEEFVERYMEVKKGVRSNSFEDNLLQCGMGLKERGRDYDVFCMVTELWDYGVVIGEEKMVIRENSVYNNTTSWRELYDKYVFIDGSPCGKLRETK